MEMLNSVLRAVVSACLYPFRGFHPLVGLTVVSLVTAVAALLVFKVSSNQSGLAAIKRQIHASLFEIRLFNDDLLAILRAQFDLLRHNLKYIGYSLVPMLWMIVPFFLLFAQLQFHYGYAPVEPGEPVLVEARLAEGWEGDTPVEDVDGFTKPLASLQAPEGVRVETPTLWAPEIRELSWRVVVDQPGEHEVAVELGGQRYTKRLDAGEELAGKGLISPIRPDHNLLEQLLYPAEPPLPDGPIESITVSYPASEFFGVQAPWMWAVVWLVLMTVFAVLLRNKLGVSI
jgi:hypothetical protein